MLHKQHIQIISEITLQYNQKGNQEELRRTRETLQWQQKWTNNCQPNMTFPPPTVSFCVHSLHPFISVLCSFFLSFTSHNINVWEKYFHNKRHRSCNWDCPCGKTILAGKILNAWYFVYMSDRISVSLNWGRLCIVCEKEAEELRGGNWKKGETEEVLRCLNALHMDKEASVLSLVSVTENICKTVSTPNGRKSIHDCFTYKNCDQCSVLAHCWNTNKNQAALESTEHLQFIPLHTFTILLGRVVGSLLVPSPLHPHDAVGNQCSFVGFLPGPGAMWTHCKLKLSLKTRYSASNIKYYTRLSWVDPVL